MRRHGLLWSALLLSAAFGNASAYEIDAYYQRQQPLADATPVLNREMNRAIAEAAAECSSNRDETCVINGIFDRVGGYRLVDKLERWAWESPEVQRVVVPVDDSIYAGIPFWVARNSFLFELGPIIELAGQRVGTDKIGHFLSQGRKFNRRWRRMRDEAKAADWAAFTERGIFGMLTTGDYSNADLVANYEGHRFYRSLFEDDIVPGREAILRRNREGWVVQRAFDWADYVNAYWDEVINTNHYDGLMQPWVLPNLRKHCDEYAQAPAAYSIDPSSDQKLRARYAFLQLQHVGELRLSVLCTATADANGAH